MCVLTSDRIHDLESQGLYSNPAQFYDFLQNRVMIIFKPKYEADHDHPEFSLILSKKQNYDTASVLCILVPSYSTILQGL
jgi:ubiquitin carboxyl-terminal hydrolase 7